MIGQQVRNYRIESLLGTGGMGSVYLAVHTQLGRKIAIKVLHPTLTGNPLIRERFRNEAATLSHLHHPNIVTLYDYWEEEDKLYLFLEYVEGKPLDEYIHTVSGPIPDAKAVPLFSKILEAVAYAHDQHVIHRDIKPSNIIINNSGSPKILDFGIAKLIGHGVDTMTKTGTRMGTVLYMSPEQVRGESLDKRSDVYSLGVTLFQMLTGHSPYEGDNLSEYVVYQHILNDPLPRMQARYPGVSDQMQGLVDKATAKNPAERFQDCHAFRQALMDNTTPLASAVNSQTTATLQEKLRPAVPPPNPQLAHTTIARPNQTKITSTIGAKETKKKGTNWLAMLLGIGVLLSLLGVILALLPEDREISRNDSPPVIETKPERSKKQPSPTVEAEETKTPATHETETVSADSVSVVTPPVEEGKKVSAEALSRIHLEYEPVPPSADSASGGNNRFALKIVLSNAASNIAFNNVTLRIRFLNEENRVLGIYLYEHGRLEPGAVERFNVERRVQAVNATCEVISAEPEKLEQPE